MPSDYDFDTLPDRRRTGSLKWDKYAKRDILPMWVADMDFTSAPEIMAALRERVDHGVFGYTVPYEAANSAILGYLRRAHGYAAQEDWLNWLPGLVPALTLCCHAFAGPDESVMTATPVYPPFLSAPEYAGRERITVPLRLDARDRWTLDFEAMEKAVKPNTRIFILCNPHNPVGRVYTRAELQELAAFCDRHDLVLISDEIHCDLVWGDSARHLVTATLGPEVAARTVTLMAPSKTYNLPGLSCAYAVIEDPKLRHRFRRAIRGIITEVNCFGYAGCVAAYEHGEPWRQALLAYLKSNYDYLVDFLRARLPGIGHHPMEATYLAWFDVSALGLDDPAGFFERAGVGLSDGVPFGAEQCLRLNFGCPRPRLTEALERMERALRAG